jgi:DNA primase
VVASCGTALTVLQAQLLRRFTTRVVLSYDPDAAGEGAVARSCELLVREGFDVNVVALDRGEDPDTFIRRQGAEAYRERLRASKPYLEYLMEQAAGGLDFSKAEVQRTFLGKMLAIAAWLPEATTRDQLADKVAHRANITAEVVRNEFRKLAARRQTGLSRTELPGLGEIKKAEKALIWWVIQRPAEALTALRTLEDEDLRPLATREVLELAKSLENLPPEQVPSALIQRLSEGDTQLVTSIAAEQAPPAKSLTECVAAVRRLRLDRERAALQRQIDWLQEQDAGRDDGEIEKLYQRKIALLHQMEELT